MPSAILFEAQHLAGALLMAALAAGGWFLAVRARWRARRHREVNAAAQGFQLLVERNADPVIIIDAEGTITYVNPAAMRTFGYGEDRVGTSALAILHPDEVESTVRRIAAAVDGDPLEGVTLRRIRTGDDRWICCESVSTNLLGEPGVRGIVVNLRDVTERLAADEQAAAEHVFTQTILDTTPALVVTATLDGHVISLNRSAEVLTGYSSAEAAGLHWVAFVPEEERTAVAGALAGLGPQAPPTSLENHWTTRDGRRRLIAWTNALVHDADGRPERIVATGLDVTEVRRAERAVREADRREHDRLAWDATHDALTTLYNRAGLLDRLDHLLAGPDDQPIAILFVDLDGFKAVNDAHGHAAGDQVLQVVAKRLVESVRADDVVGRLGGDEFVVLCPNLVADQAVTTAGRIERSVAAPIVVGGLTLQSGASTGVVTTTGGHAADLLEQADAAMYAVKRGRQSRPRAAAVPGPAPLHPQEDARLAALHGSGLLDTAADPFVDTIVRLAAEVCGTPMAAVSLIDADRQWFKSRVGIDDDETTRDVAFCAHTILDDAETMVVEDAAHDLRFEQNPMVAGDPNVRFYAGAPITLAGAPPLGSLCVIDDRPRQLTRHQLETLERLRDSLVVYLELTHGADRGDQAGVTPG